MVNLRTLSLAYHYQLENREGADFGLRMAAIDYELQAAATSGAEFHTVLVPSDMRGMFISIFNSRNLTSQIQDDIDDRYTAIRLSGWAE